MGVKKGVVGHQLASDLLRRCWTVLPEGPKIEKIQDFPPGLKLSSDQSEIEIFNRD